jgi:hypothetical protein
MLFFVGKSWVGIAALSRLEYAIGQRTACWEELANKPKMYWTSPFLPELTLGIESGIHEQYT